MTITVAGNKKEVADNLTVAQLIIDENVETPEYVTVTINDEFVKSGTFEETTLKDGDVVEFLYVMGGGQYWHFQTNSLKDIQDILFLKRSAQRDRKSSLMQRFSLSVQADSALLPQCILPPQV